MKEEGREVGERGRRRSKSGARRGGRNKEVKVNVVEDYEVEGEIKDESGEGERVGGDEKVVEEHQSVSPS